VDKGGSFNVHSKNHKVNLETKYLTVSLPRKSTTFRLTKAMIIYAQVKVNAMFIVNLLTARLASRSGDSENQPVAITHRWPVPSQSVEGDPKLRQLLRVCRNLQITAVTCARSADIARTRRSP